MENPYDFLAFTMVSCFLPFLKSFLTLSGPGPKGFTGSPPGCYRATGEGDAATHGIKPLAANLVLQSSTFPKALHGLRIQRKEMICEEKFTADFS